MDEKRLVVALFGVVVALIAGYIAHRFVAALTVAVFLYYSTRRFYHALGRFRLPARLRAATALSVIAVPLLFLLSSTIVLLLVEARRFIERYPIAESVGGGEPWIGRLQRLSDLSVRGAIDAYRSGQFDPLVGLVVDNAALLTNTASGFLLNVLITVVVTYYLLLDGSTLHAWLLRFDDDAIVREYLEAADAVREPAQRHRHLDHRHRDVHRVQRRRAAGGLRAVSDPLGGAHRHRESDPRRRNENRLPPTRGRDRRAGTARL
jgi:predicted PurR-regulated permease PerM